MNLQGCGTALITPFRQDGSLDEPALRAHIHWQIACGISLLIPCGTTGEAATLTETEWLRVVEITVEAAKPQDGNDASNAELQLLIRRENWLAAQLELYGDPPPATMRPFETWGPPAPPDEDDVPLPGDASDAGHAKKS